MHGKLSASGLAQWSSGDVQNICGQNYEITVADRALAQGQLRGTTWQAVVFLAVAHRRQVLPSSGGRLDKSVNFTGSLGLFPLSPIESRSNAFPSDLPLRLFPPLTSAA
ncbi:unnamed protein product [[Candida] boidinii]|uniref:Unnamed protein product n=1 Tax=Candida boidinii TaxID=5477 RepID=A0ACB5TTA0_CANBO|nr:unnamed protein product [[Candida] boidinii]